MKDSGAMVSSVLSDGTIRRLVGEGRIKVEPWEPAMVQPASVDLRLGNSFRVFHNHRVSAIDLAAPPEHLTELVEVSDEEPFVIHPQEFCLGRTLEWVELPDDLVARIEGKALALDTEVPTPDGWTTMGEIRAGEWVFDPTGAPVRVLGVTGEIQRRPCREIVFSDGTRVVADIYHEWEVRSRYDRNRRNPYRVLSTAEIGASLKLGREYNWHVAQTGAVQYPERELPIDPYVLGAWLGDGTSTRAELTTADGEILAELAVAGYGVRKTAAPLGYRVGLGSTPHARDAVTGRYTANGSLQSTLRAAGLLGNKHVPREYLEASVDQRRALLHGLMDTDGYVDKWGRCELTTVGRHLAEAYHELIAGLGFRPVIATKRAMYDGRDCGPKYDVTFTPGEPVFRLPRKLARQKLAGRFKRGRSIVAVNEVDSVPVRCIQVDDRRGAYLITRSFIPTHNSSLGRLGLIVHATAGFVDPGFKGTLTLEITNLTRVPIVLWPGKPIAQLSFMTLDRAAVRPYGHPDLGSHYHGQVDATESRYEGGPTRRANDG
jgi:deoxycytidine triphosphate deaminase